MRGERRPRRCTIIRLDDSSPPPLPSPPTSSSPPTPGSSATTILFLASPAPTASLPSPSPPKKKTCDCSDPECTVDCKEDYYEEEWEDGRCLDTRKPDWTLVFPERPGICRFCRQSLCEKEDGNFIVCYKISVFQLVLKYAPRWCSSKQY